MIETVAKNRDTYFDSLKFILITLVIMGHVLEKNRENSLCLALYNTIYLFHMPLFVFVSGYFSKKHTDVKKSLKSLLLLVESLFCFQLLHKLPGLLSGKETILSIFIYPGWTMWYLYSLIIWRTIIYITPPYLLINYKITLWATLVACLFAGFIPIDGMLSFQRTIVFMPFFFLGYYSGQKYFDFKRYQISNTFSALTLIFAFIFMLVIDRNLDSILYGNSHYGHGLLSLGLRLLQLIAAVITGVSVISLTKIFSERYNKIGRNTLFLYLYHTFIISALMKVLQILDVPQNMWMALIELCIVGIILIILLRIKILHKLLNPISQLIIKRK